METLSLPKDLVTEALKQALDKAQVPQRQHLMIVQALQRRMQDHQRDMTTHQDILKNYEAELKAHEQKDSEHEAQITSFKSELDRYAQLAQGEQGEAGQNGQDADQEAILSHLVALLPQYIPAPIPGLDGRDGMDGKDAEFDEEVLLEKFLTKIKKGRLLDMSHIKNAQGWLKDGVKYKFEELMHGSGKSTGGSSTFVYNEIVSGSGTSFTLSKTPLTGAQQIYGEGQLLTPGALNDYTISGENITTTNSFATGAITATYQTS